MNGDRAKKFYDRNGSMSGIHYHTDDRDECIGYLREMAPAGSTLAFIRQPNGYHDVYVIQPNNLRYVSKYVGCMLDLTIWDHPKKSGLDLRSYETSRLVAELSDATHGDPNALTYQEIR